MSQCNAQRPRLGGVEFCQREPHTDARHVWPNVADFRDAELASLRSRLASALEVVRSVEWVPSCCYDAFCPMCGGPKTYGQQRVGHAPGCALAALLENKGDAT